MTDYEKAKIQIAVALIRTGITDREAITQMVDDLVYDLTKREVVTDDLFVELKADPTFSSDDIPF